MHHHPKGFLPIAVVLVAVVVALVVAGASYWYTKDKNEEVVNMNTAVVTNTNTVVNENVNTAVNSNTNAATNGNATVNENTNTAADPTAGWKTYTNATYNYSFKYPSEWDFNESQVPYGDKKYDGIQLTLKETPTNLSQPNVILKFGVTVFPRQANQDALTAYLQAVPSDLSTTKKSAVTVAGIAGTKVEGIPGHAPYDAIFIPRGGYAFELESNALGSVELKSLLSTFSFLADTAGWKTYTNAKLGYSVKYPKDWVVEETVDKQEVDIYNKISANGKFGVPAVQVIKNEKLRSDDSCLEAEVQANINNILRTRQTMGCAYAGSRISTFFPKDSEFIAVSWTTDWEDYYPQYETILSTFTFTK